MGSRAVGLLMMALLGLSVGACRRNKTPVAPDPPADFEARLFEAARQRWPDADPLDTSMAGLAEREDEGGRWPLNLEKDNCYLIVGVGDATVEDIYLILFDAEDDDREKEKDESPVVMEYCPKESGPFTLEGKVVDGRGHFRLGVFVHGDGSTPAPAPVAAAPAPGDSNVTEPAPAGTSGGGLASSIDGLAAKEAAGAARIGSLYQGDADRSDWYAALEAGKCYWLVGAAEGEVTNLEVTLLDPANKPVTKGGGETTAVTKFCPKEGGMFHIQAAIQGSGPYAVGLYAK